MHSKLWRAICQFAQVATCAVSFTAGVQNMQISAECDLNSQP